MQLRAAAAAAAAAASSSVTPELCRTKFLFTSLSVSHAALSCFASEKKPRPRLKHSNKN